MNTPDPITSELIRNSLQAIVDEMALTLVRTAYSANLKSAMDLSSAMCDARGRLIAQGLTLPLHLGSIPDAIDALLLHFGGQFRPGDAFVLNDPYDGGTHLPDFFVFQPLFDADQLVAFAVTVAHHTDVGGRVAGSNASDSTEIYAEGLRIAPLKFYEAGVLNKTLATFIERNVRLPVKVFGDLRAQLAACHIAEKQFAELVAKYGAEQTRVYMRETIDYAERLTRAALEKLPDGEW
ncbi:MAG TPA: hydantoinase B/oxoprolinase family protein, partial [Chloroflexota bacterium]